MTKKEFKEQYPSLARLLKRQSDRGREVIRDRLYVEVQDIRIPDCWSKSPVPFEGHLSDEETFVLTSLTLDYLRNDQRHWQRRCIEREILDELIDKRLAEEAARKLREMP